MSDLQNKKPFPAQFIENGHATSLRRGKAFIFDAALAGIGVGASVNIRFVTGDAAILFESGNVSTNQEEVTLSVFEDTIYSAAGSIDATIIRNMNRLMDTAPEIEIYTGPTVDTDGDLVVHQIVLGTAGKNQNFPGFGGGAQDASFILKPNTEHLFRVTNGSAAAVDIEAHYYYHEVDPREYGIPA